MARHCAKAAQDHQDKSFKETALGILKQPTVPYFSSGTAALSWKGGGGVGQEKKAHPNPYLRGQVHFSTNSSKPFTFSTELHQTIIKNSKRTKKQKTTQTLNS